ncbi:hypothetical protein FK220_015235 [Flavobacteriaceae bacterium TP-CH-4]|uniref:ABM domain-containing protein n=1 Tax=Pelagihabitans pacificus TaxID=2696054 RepID=A0A967EET9_9FLAO|nr:hypothetical protein [Pelagihabitans pacificus]NHF60708.1 hypothetical protein [Pelagihabitans pacificus]
MTNLVCIEVVRFKGNPAFSTVQVQEAMAKTNAYIKEFDGFIKRTISVNEEGEFLDIVYWESMQQAKNAAIELQQNPKIMEHFKVIDFSTVTMKHFNSFSNSSKHE